MPVLVLVDAIAKPECVEELKTFFQDRVPETRAFTGCREITAHLNEADGRSFVLIEKWDAKDDYQKYF